MTPTDKAKSHKKTWFESLLREHKRWFSFAGAAIVFMTFILKDNVREYYRGLASAFDAAESILAVRKDTIQTNIKLMALERKIDFIQKDVTSVSKDEPTWRYGVYAPRDEWEKVGLNPDESVSDPFALEALRDICREFPPENVNCKYRREMSDELDLAIQTYDDQAIFDRDSGDNNHEYEEQMRTALEAKYERLKEVRKGHSESFADRLQDLTEKITKDAEELRVRAEKTDRYLGKATIFLYTLGWGLGLLGRVYGVEETGAGGE